MEDVGQPDYLRYWGKTRKSAVEGEPNWHLLAWHCLDVAACGYKMAESNRFGLRDRLAACGIDGQNALNWIGWRVPRASGDKPLKCSWQITCWMCSPHQPR